jgi:putative glutamine amidotransferase
MSASNHHSAHQDPTQRPLWIGITTRHGDAGWVERNTRNYVAVVRQFGAEPIILSPDVPVALPNGKTYSPDSNGRLPAGILHALDGLILSGGGDVHPRYFGQQLNGAEPHSIDEKRDELELALAPAALEHNLPVFGICRGCQVLNVAMGGGMVQHFEGHRTPEGGDTHFHDVTILPGSRLHAVVADSALCVNTFHHQGVDAASLAPVFTPVAIAAPDEWLVEAYESRSHRWVLGVQWHPERQFELDAGHRRIWESFFGACREYQARQSANPAES